MNWRTENKRRLRRQTRHIALEVLCQLTRVRQNFRLPNAIPKVQILLLHDLADAEQGRFRQLLSQLATRYRFVSYSNAVHRIVTGEIDQSYLAFSFDDGLYGCWSAAGILEEYGVRGMFFVCPQIVAADRPQQARICRERLLIEPSRFLSWAEIEELKRRGHEFGSHTQNHVYANRVSTDQLAQELLESRDEIQRRLGTCDHFAWPYGRFSHFHPSAQKLVTRIGYLSCASGERGAHATHDESLRFVPCIRRESIEVRWPMRHVRYFLERSGQLPLSPSECWPREWQLVAGHPTTTKKRVA